MHTIVKTWSQFNHLAIGDNVHVSCPRVVHGSLFLDPTRRKVDPTQDCRKKSDQTHSPTLPHMYSLELNNYLIIS